MTRHYRVSADIGGTFTDIVYQDCSTGACGATKILSTPDDPALAVLLGIEAAIPPEAAIDFFVHGTTVGLNALHTRRGAKVALLTTENFETSTRSRATTAAKSSRSAGTSPSRSRPWRTRSRRGSASPRRARS